MQVKFKKNMKKLLLLSAVSLFGALNAQQTKFGLKGGYALSNLESKELDNMFEDFGVRGSNQAKSGYFVGAFVEHKLNDKFAVQGEVQYANLGGQIEAKFDEGGIKYTLQDKFHFNQIIIPIAAKYFITSDLAVYGGPSVAFSTGYESKITIKDSNIPSEFNNDINTAISQLEADQNKALKEELKSTNFNIFVGGEYQFYKALFIDARYSFGLTNYEKNPVDNSKTRMNYLQIGLGYKF